MLDAFWDIVTQWGTTVTSFFQALPELVSHVIGVFSMPSVMNSPLNALALVMYLGCGFVVARVLVHLL